MSLVIHDYTVSDVDQMSTNNRDFELEHNEKRICIEIPKSKLNTLLKTTDGVLMANGHEVQLKNYLHLVAQRTGYVLAMLRVRGDMSGTGVRGMKQKHIAKLLQKLGLNKSSIKNINDADVIANYFPGVE